MVIGGTLVNNKQGKESQVYRSQEQGPRNLYGRDGQFRPTFKSGAKKRWCSVTLLMIWCYQIDHPKSKLNIEFCSTFSVALVDRQSSLL